jgi:hypothetical protein
MNHLDGCTFELREAVSGKRFKVELGHNLYKLLNEALKHYSVVDVPEPFPKSVADLVLKLHQADNTGTAFRYAGNLTDVQEHADFPDLATLHDQFETLSNVEDYVDGLYSEVPTLGHVSADYC